MQATRGFAVLVRRRGRLLGCSAALALMLMALAGSTVASAATPPPIKEQYLALGDSLAFGYSTQLYHEGEVAGYEDPEGFENGYANAFLKKIKAKAMKVGSNVKLVNDGCPGETTESLIGKNAEYLGTLNAVLKKSQEEHGLPPVTGEEPLAKLPNCEYQEAWQALKTVGKGGPLHHPYPGKSQLEDALKTIAYAQNVEKKPVTTITLNIGANDELHALAGVEGAAKAFVEAKLAKVGQEAVEAKLKKVAEEAIKAKLAKVAAEAIEAKVAEQVFIKCSEKAFVENGESFEEPGYAEKREACLANEGKKLGEEYFAENQAKLEKEGEEAAGKYFFEHKAEVEKEGKEAAEKYFGEHKAEVEKEGKEAAEKYFAEHKFDLGNEAEVFAGEQVAKAAPALFGQINSNLAGIMLAIRKAGTLGLDGGKDADYNGRIIFQGGYNPFGKQFNFAFEAVEFVKEHGPAYALLNGRCKVHGATEAAEIKKIEEGCEAAAVHPGFTALAESLNKADRETVNGGFGACTTAPAKQFNPFSPTIEAERLKLWTNMTNGTSTGGKPNGPDIHPTPAGYFQLAKEMLAEQNTHCKKEGLPGF